MFVLIFVCELMYLFLWEEGIVPSANEIQKIH